MPTELINPKIDFEPSSTLETYAQRGVVADRRYKPLYNSIVELDLHMGPSCRSFKSKGSESIAIFGEFGLANQLGCIEYSRL